MNDKPPTSGFFCLHAGECSLTRKVRHGMYRAMQDAGASTPHRAKVLNTLAIVGFIALIGASMWLAFYSTRYVPDVVGRLGSAAVYLGSAFASESEPSLSVVPTPETPTVISFGEASSTISTGADAAVAASTQISQTRATVPSAGRRTSGTYQIGGTPTSNSVFGLPDLAVTIRAVGYLTSTSTNSFIATSTVTSGSRPAVTFTIKNIGTNVSGQWRFRASIPTQSSYIYESQLQQSLAPGDSIDYTLGFDQAIPGSGKIISVTANFDSAIAESSAANNTASASLTILGG